MKHTQPAKALALQTIRSIWADFMAREPGTLRGEDPEQLHRMRVAHRRLRTALGAFEPVLPPELVAAEPELRWIGGELGYVRDLDVQLEEMAETTSHLEVAPETVETLLSAVRAEREVARARMLEALTSSRFEALVLQIARSLREQVTAEPAANEPAIGDVAPVMLQERYADFLKAARGLTPKSAPTAFHKARRRARKLRFTTEFVEAVYGEPAEDLVESMKDLQDLFGEHQDCYAAIELRRRVCKSLQEPARRLARDLDERDLERAAAIRKQAGGAVKDVRRRWKALKKVLRD